jgi:hypothetical protein
VIQTEAGTYKPTHTCEDHCDRSGRSIRHRGASDAGKSSFLRAGLFPRLRRDDRNFLPLAIIRPERAAISGETGLLAALEDAFAAARIPISRADLRAVGLKPERVESEGSLPAWVSGNGGAWQWPSAVDEPGGEDHGGRGWG